MNTEKLNQLEAAYGKTQETMAAAWAIYGEACTAYGKGIRDAHFGRIRTAWFAARAANDVARAAFYAAVEK